MGDYLLFQGSRCYPEGGWCDFKGAFTDLDQAAAEGARLCDIDYRACRGNDPWFHVATIKDGIVFSADNQ